MKNETKKSEAKKEVKLSEEEQKIENQIQKINSGLSEGLEFQERKFKKLGVEYTGRVFTNTEEYIAELAKRNGVTAEAALNGIVLGYQGLQMTRVTPNDPEVIAGMAAAEVWSLYGTRTSKWGDLKKYVEIARDHLKNAGLSAEEITDEKLLEVAEKMKTSMENLLA